jgi:hypothetical protein
MGTAEPEMVTVVLVKRRSLSRRITLKEPETVKLPVMTALPVYGNDTLPEPENTARRSAMLVRYVEPLTIGITLSLAMEPEPNGVRAEIFIEAIQDLYDKYESIFQKPMEQQMKDHRIYNETSNSKCNNAPPTWNQEQQRNAYGKGFDSFHQMPSISELHQNG